MFFVSVDTLTELLSDASIQKSSITNGNQEISGESPVACLCSAPSCRDAEIIFLLLFDNLSLSLRWWLWFSERLFWLERQVLKGKAHLSPSAQVCVLKKWNFQPFIFLLTAKMFECSEVPWKLFTVFNQSVSNWSYDPNVTAGFWWILFPWKLEQKWRYGWQ